MSGQRQALVGLTTRQIQDIVVGLGERRFRGSQIAAWVYRNQAGSFEEMTDLPTALRSRLSAGFVLNPLVVAAHRASSDGVEKLLVHNGDCQVYECVLLPYSDRVSCCLSSQVGCPMACTFCATGLGGFDRDLTAGEIVGQYLLLQRRSSRRIGHVVFMGMGEPLLNLTNVLSAVRVLSSEVGLSLRHVTLSTVGVVPQIEKLADERLPIHLALSLHSPIDEVRSRLMPVNRKWPVTEVVAAMRRYQAATGRKVTFEYLLIDHMNDTAEQADLLARLLKGLKCVVNLIPFNHVETPEGFRRPSRERVLSFRRILESRGVNVTERTERGHDIAAACGQLAGQHAGRFGRGLLASRTVAQ
jgi:23S rRNA (adenine2503-C2)-methyltransferase